MVILIVLSLLAALSIIYFTLKNGISPMPSSSHARQTVLEQAAKLLNRDVIIEAGSGWGTLAFQAARRFPGSRIIGLENSWVPLLVSRFMQLFYAYPALRFIRTDIYTFDYAQADIVLCYLYPGAMKCLKTLLEQGMKQDAWVISIFFAIPDWKPKEVIECQDMYRTKIYVYQAPSKVQ
jgi:hypothetical protein